MANRIKTLVDLIKNNSVVADIGCDHAYLIIELLKQNKVIYAFGIDNKDGPINNAKTNLSKYPFTNYSLIKADGLNFSFDKKIDTLVFAGLGGLNTIEIIDENKDKLKNIKYIVTDIHRDDNKVKEYLINLNYQIDEEINIIDKKKKYHLVRYIKN